MRKLNLKQVETTYGGSPCSATAGAIAGFGLSVAMFPTPLNWAFGGVVAAVGGAAYFACK